jgi:hypothetical protein
MTIRATDEILGKLHDAIAKNLLERVQSGEATAQELQAAIKFLKDNGIDATPEKGSDLEKLTYALPSFTDDDEAFTQ